MSMSGGGKRGDVVSEINVTPLVDIMLVLLIIMMLIAPLLQKGVDVNLPTAGNMADKPDTQQQIVLHVTADKRFYVNNKEVPERDVVDRIKYRARRGQGEGGLSQGRSGRAVRVGDADDGQDARRAD